MCVSLQQLPDATHSDAYICRYTHTPILDNTQHRSLWREIGELSWEEIRHIVQVVATRMMLVPAVGQADWRGVAEALQSEVGSSVLHLSVGTMQEPLRSRQQMLISMHCNTVKITPHIPSHNETARLHVVHATLVL